MPSWLTFTTNLMPNYCESVLEISNLSKDSFNKLISQYTKQEGQEERTLVFNKIIPEPTNDKGEPAEDWYDFRVNNWGTKWEPNTYSFEASSSDKPDLDDGYISIGMSTAWAPPLGIVRKLSELFPEAEFRITYVEPGCCFMGEEHFSGGEQTYEMYSEDLEKIKEAYPEYWEFDDEEAEEESLKSEKVDSLDDPLIKENEDEMTLGSMDRF